MTGLNLDKELSLTKSCPLSLGCWINARRPLGWSLPCLVFDPLLAFHTKTSLPVVSGSFSSETSPQRSLLLSSLALNPKWSESNHQTVRCKTVGFESPSSPSANSLSSSSSITCRLALGRLPLPCFTTNCFLFEARTSLDSLNSSPFRMLAFEPWMLRCLCRLL